MSLESLSVSPCHSQNLLTREHLVHLQKGHGSLSHTEKLTFSVIWKERKKETIKKSYSLLEINAGCLSPCLLSMCLNFLTWNCWFFNVSLYIIIPLLVCSCSTTRIAIAWSKQAQLKTVSGSWCYGNALYNEGEILILQLINDRNILPMECEFRVA